MRVVAILGLILAIASISPAQDKPQDKPEAKDDAKDEPKSKIIFENWEVLLLEGNRAGYHHFIVTEDTLQGKKFLRATKELRMTLLRGGNVAQVNADIGTYETPEGKIEGVFMTQTLGKQQSLEMNGVVEGNKLNIEFDSPVKNEKSINWSPEVVGLLRESRLLREKKLKAGDSFDYLYFEPTIAEVVKISVQAGEIEMVKLPDGKSRSLLRVMMRPNKIANVQLPAMTSWIDPMTYQTIVSESTLPGLGTLKTVRSTKEIATAPVKPSEMKTDLLVNQSIQLGQRVQRIHEQGGVVYRITLTDDDTPSTTFAKDDRQSIDKIEKNSFELRVTAIRKPQTLVKPAEAGKEFLESNFFINSADAEVRKLAREAVGETKDAWQKALKIERFVKANMRSVNFGEAMATADQVAITRSGDCTEFAMLTAAMCRAEGVPSRTAVGLVYVESNPRPILAFHMWTEVFIAGQWMSIDATLGKGAIGPGHLKIADHSWYETRSVTPLLPVMRVLLAKPQVEILSANAP